MSICARSAHLQGSEQPFLEQLIRTDRRHSSEQPAGGNRDIGRPDRPGQFKAATDHTNPVLPPYRIGADQTGLKERLGRRIAEVAEAAVGVDVAYFQPGALYLFGDLIDQGAIERARIGVGNIGKDFGRGKPGIANPFQCPRKAKPRVRIGGEGKLHDVSASEIVARGLSNGTARRQEDAHPIRSWHRGTAGITSLRRTRLIGNAVEILFSANEHPAAAEEGSGHETLGALLPVSADDAFNLVLGELLVGPTGLEHDRGAGVAEDVDLLAGKGRD